MTEMFETTFDRVIGHEAGFQKLPGDRGNWTSGKLGVGLLKGTKYGVSAMTYPTLDIENLTLEQAKGIYFNDWWIKLGMDGYTPGLAYQLFDSAFNHGMGSTACMLQRAVGVPDDGKIGLLTKAAVEKKSLDDVLFLFLAERLEFMTKVGTWGDFGKGWARRIAQNMRYAAEDNGS